MRCAWRPGDVGELLLHKTASCLARSSAVGDNLDDILWSDLKEQKNGSAASCSFPRTRTQYFRRNVFCLSIEDFRMLNRQLGIAKGPS